MTLPASEITDGVAENLHLALRRYCEARLTLVQRETQVAWRQGLRSLGRGRSFSWSDCCSPLVLERDVPYWQNLLGYGVFPVVGWVGWYPLDLLFFARQPLKREARILRRLADATFGATRRHPVPPASESSAGEDGHHRAYRLGSERGA